MKRLVIVASIALMAFGCMNPARKQLYLATLDAMQDHFNVTYKSEISTTVEGASPMTSIPVWPWAIRCLSCLFEVCGSPSPDSSR